MRRRGFTGLIINEFDGLELEGPGGVIIDGGSYRVEQLKIDYDTDFKWAAVAINAGLALAGVAFGCWVCETVRHDGKPRTVRSP
jgi:hypothetical protein